MRINIYLSKIIFIKQTKYFLKYAIISLLKKFNNNFLKKFNFIK